MCDGHACDSPWVVDVSLEVSDLQDASAEWVAMVVRAVLAAEGVAAGAVSIVIGADELVQRLNRDYRGVDRVTDVLAFAMSEGADTPVLSDGLPILGDVVVSWPRARTQAEERGVPPREELALLLVHGCLHLLGYDHAEKADEQAMWRRQEMIVHNVLFAESGGETF